MRATNSCGYGCIPCQMLDEAFRFLPFGVRTADEIELRESESRSLTIVSVDKSNLFG